MASEIQSWVSTYMDCAMRTSPKLHAKAPLIALKIDAPWHRVGVDFVGLVEAFATQDMSDCMTARILFDKIICRYTAPRYHLSDRGQNLSEVIKGTCRMFGIRKANNIPYYPQCNVNTERFNQTLIQILSMFCDSRQEDWDVFIPAALFAYRVARQETIQETRLYLTYRRQATLPIDKVLLEPDEDNKIPRLKHGAIRDERNDEVEVGEAPEFENVSADGEDVEIQFEPQSAQAGNSGEGEIIPSLDDAPEKENKSVGPGDTETNSEDSEYFGIEKIIKGRLRNDRKDYLIKWTGYLADQNSWECYENLNEQAKLFLKKNPVSLSGSRKANKRRRKKLIHSLEVF
ncbi:uncharacterized protein LOC144352206 [Saccoglossus kowalevskii]